MDGSSVKVPKNYDLPHDTKPPKPISSTINVPSRGFDDPVTLDSLGSSPNLSLDEAEEEKPPEDRPDNMPVLATGAPDPDITQNRTVENKEKLTHEMRKRKLLETKFYYGQTSKPDPLEIFSIKKVSFKIPKKKKTVPKWVKNGGLWQWALTVDDNGQFSR